MFRLTRSQETDEDNTSFRLQANRSEVHYIVCNPECLYRPDIPSLDIQIHSCAANRTTYTILQNHTSFASYFVSRPIEKVFRMKDVYA